MFKLYNFVIVIINCTKVSLVFIGTLFKTIILFYGENYEIFQVGNETIISIDYDKTL